MIKDEDTAYGEWRQEQLDAKPDLPFRQQLDRIHHIGTHMPGFLTCDDGTRWHPAELVGLVAAIKAYFKERQL